MSQPTPKAVKAYAGWAILLLTMLSGCANGPRPLAEPPIRQQALNLETRAAQAYSNGRWAEAQDLFMQSLRLQTSLDDLDAQDRHRLHLARTALALEQTSLAKGWLTAVQQPAYQMDARVLLAQAELDSGNSQAALDTLTALEDRCTKLCPQHASLTVLRARAFLAHGAAGHAAQAAQAAITLLDKPTQMRERANAWRLLAGARLELGEDEVALQSAQRALDLDRELALPEKIGADWLLIGDIRRRRDGNQARAAYVRAREVAASADLPQLLRRANQALENISP